MFGLAGCVAGCDCWVPFAVLGAMGGMPRSSVRGLGATLGWAW